MVSSMGKFKQSVDTAGLRVGNTIATWPRIVAEAGLAFVNVFGRQELSSVKNIKEVQMQSINAMTDNFLNFSKVDGKRYQKLLKGSINAISAVTRRPFMLAGAEALSTLNQWVRHPFKKLLFTPFKMFKWMWNATRIFSKKKGFDFTQYDTHETGTDTWINQIRENRIGFFGKGWWSSVAAESSKGEDKKSEEKKPEEKKSDVVSKEDNPEEKKSRWWNNPNRWGTWRWDKDNSWAKKSNDKAPEAPNPERGSQERLAKMEAEGNDAEVDKYLAERWKPAGAEFWSDEKTIDEVNAKQKEEAEEKKAKEDWNKSKTIDGIKKEQKEESAKKEKTERDEKFPERDTMADKFKIWHRKEYKKILKGKTNKEWIVERGKQAKLWTKPEEIVENLKEKDPTFAGYMEDEILAKAA